jgi:radical SAM superfamily enzyme YgiQ (UPF0313 family)
LNIVLISTYELGHQPLGLAHPAALLRAAGHAVRCIDLAVEPLDEQAVQLAQLIGLSVPMHTATRLAMRLAPRLRRLNPGAHLCCYGLYASLNASVLLGPVADSVIGGEFEPALLSLAGRLSQPGQLPIDGSLLGVITIAGGSIALDRQRFALPARDLLPPLERYAKLDDGERLRLAGYLEASRGCAHRCLHCPITPVYAGRLRVVQEEVVLADVRQLVGLGAEHLSFGDPDFFNGIRHSLRIIEAVHAEFPSLSYDVTIKVEHLLEHRAHLRRLAETGCAFVVSAVEAVDDQVLRHLDKGHSASDVELALGLMREVGLVLRPTFVAFTPWTSLDSYLGLLEFVERRGLIEHIAPIQYAIRLLIPLGSSLLAIPALTPHLGSFDDQTLTYTWQHPDSRMDQLQRDAARLVEVGTQRHDAAATIFSAIKARALDLAGRSPDPPWRSPPALSAGRVPRLTENWYC